MTTRRWMIAVAVVGIGAGLIRGCVLLYRGFEVWGARIHQQSVTRSLAEWEREYSVIRDSREADRAMAMLEYVARYYVPGPGYHSDPVTEAALKMQRARTLNAIATALRQYSGQDFGVDATRWRTWAAQQNQPYGDAGTRSDPLTPR